LRFLALTVLSIDPDPRGVICMEEPENGIHPERIPAMIQLLVDLTADVTEEEFESQGRHLRQVIINTHSPAVVMQVPDDSLLMAETVEVNREGFSFKALRLRGLEGTWRSETADVVSKGQLLAYLNPVAHDQPDDWRTTATQHNGSNSKRARRVIDRDDLKQYKIPFPEISE